MRKRTDQILRQNEYDKGNAFQRCEYLRRQIIELNHQTEKWDADMRTEINTLKKVKSRYVNIEEEKYHYEELVENQDVN